MDEKHEKIKCLTEELEKARFEAAMQADRADSCPMKKAAQKHTCNASMP